MSGYGSVLGSPSVSASPGALGSVYYNSNPALLPFESAQENPTAASLGVFSPTGLTQISSGGLGYGSFTQNGGAGGYGGYHSAGLNASYGGNPIGSNSPLTGLRTCMDAGNSFLTCLGKGFGAGVGAGASSVGGGIASGFLGAFQPATVGLVAVALVLLLGAFIYMGRK